MNQNEKRIIKTQPEAAGDGRNKKRQKRPEVITSLWTPNLPPELWVSIFQMFSFKSMHHLASVCRDWAGLWRRYISQTLDRRIKMYGSMEELYRTQTSAYEHCLVGAAVAGDIKWVNSMMDKYGLCQARSQYRAIVAHKLHRFWALGDPVLFWKIREKCHLQKFWELKLLRGLVKLGRVKHIKSWMKQTSMKKILDDSGDNFRDTFVPGSMEALNWILNYNGKDTNKNLVNPYAMAVLSMKRGDRILFMEAMCRNKGSKFYTHDIGDIWRWASYYLCFWALPLLTKLPKTIMSFLLPIVSVSKSRIHKSTPFGLVREVYLKKAMRRYFEIARERISASERDLCIGLYIHLSRPEWKELYLACAKRGDVGALEFFTEELAGEKAKSTYLAPYTECINVESWKWFWAKGCSVSHLDQLDWERIGNKGDEALAKYMCQNPCDHKEPLMTPTALLNIMCSSKVSCRLFRFLRYLCWNAKDSLLILKNSYHCVRVLQRLYRSIGGKQIPLLTPLVPEWKSDSSAIEWPRRKSLIISVRHLLQQNPHHCNGFCKHTCLCCGQTQGKKKEKKV